MGFVLSTKHSFVNIWNCCWPILCAFLTVSTGLAGRWVAQFFHYVDEWADVFPKLILHACCLVMVDHLVSSSHEPVCIFKVLNQRSNLMASYHPPQEGTRFVYKTYRPSITLDASIILLMCLIDGDCREDPVGLLNREISSFTYIPFPFPFSIPALLCIHTCGTI